MVGVVVGTKGDRRRSGGLVPRIESALEFAVRSRVLLGSVQLRLPAVEDLLIMKAIARRPKDLLDVDGLLDVHPHTDLHYVRRHISEFARAAAMGDIVEEFERLIVRRRSG